MNLRAEHFTGPLFMSATMAIGVGLVLTINALASFFAVPETIAPQENIGVTSTENFKTMTARESPHEKGRVLACYDMAILPIWKELKEDEDFKRDIAQVNGLLNCSDMVEIKRMNLNQDSTDEFLVQGKGPALCGGGGNCRYWIFGFRDGAMTKLLTGVHQADQYELGVDEVQKSRAHGYPDILLTDRDGQFVLRFRTYRFDGNEYAESRCTAEVPKSLRDGPGSEELISCDEYDRRRDEIRNL